MTKEKKIYYFISIILLGFFLAVIFHYYIGSYLGNTYPYNTFLTDPRDRFTDFYRTVDMKDLNPYFRPTPSGYFPFAILIGYLLSLFGLIPALGFYIITFSTSLAYFCKINLSNANPYLGGIGTLVFTFFTFPYMFTMDRGNIEGVILILLLLYITFFTRKRYIIASLVLSLAIALKVFPAALLILFIPEKKYKEIIISVISTGFLTIASLLLFKGGVWNNFLHLLTMQNISSYYSTSYFGATNVIFHGVNIFNLLKIVFIETGFINSINMVQFLRFYTIMASIIFILVALYVVFIEKVFWRQVTLLIIAMIALPLLAADYRLIFLYIPLLLFINSSENTKLDFIFTILLGLLFIPKNYYYLPKIVSDYQVSDIPIGTPINIIILLFIPCLIISFGFREWHNKKKSSIK